MNVEESKKSKLGLLVTACTGGLAIAISVICVPFVTPALRRICLPYVPATSQQLENVLIALKGRSGSAIDLGSGDGRIVLALAKQGFTAHGVELNPWLIRYSKFSALYHGLSKKTVFYKQNLWRHDLSPYKNIIVFGVEQMMVDIEKKCLEELGKDCSIVACRFPLPGIVPVETIGCGVDTVWVYRVDGGFE